MFGLKRVACSFCGRSAEDVTKLVAGPKVYICDECVAVADRIMKGDEPPEPPLQRGPHGLFQKLRVRLHALLDRGRVHCSGCQSVALAQR